MTTAITWQANTQERAFLGFDITLAFTHQTLCFGNKSLSWWPWQRCQQTVLTLPTPRAGSAAGPRGSDGPRAGARCLPAAPQETGRKHTSERVLRAHRGTEPDKGETHGPPRQPPTKPTEILNHSQGCRNSAKVPHRSTHAAGRAGPGDQGQAESPRTPWGRNDFSWG